MNELEGKSPAGQRLRRANNLCLATQVIKIRLEPLSLWKERYANDCIRDVRGDSPLLGSFSNRGIVRGQANPTLTHIGHVLDSFDAARRISRGCSRRPWPKRKSP